MGDGTVGEVSDLIVRPSASHSSAVFAIVAAFLAFADTGLAGVSWSATARRAFAAAVISVSTSLAAAFLGAFLGGARFLGAWAAGPGVTGEVGDVLSSLLVAGLLAALPFLACARFFGD